MESGGSDTSEQSQPESAAKSGEQTRTRRTRQFPQLSFMEALALPDAVQQLGAGQPIRRLTLLEQLGRSPTSSTTRILLTTSNQYGLTEGSYNAEVLSLTPLGSQASDPDAPARERARSRIRLGILNVPSFAALYERYKGSRLPTPEVLRDAARAEGIDEANVAECAETFLANARDLGLVRQIGGSEHLVDLETALDSIPEAGPSAKSAAATPSPPSAPPEQAANVTRLPVARMSPTGDLSQTCFVISPIGEVDSVHRKHADLVLSSLIEPAIAELGLAAVRADKISKPGLITGQVIDYVTRSALVIADLSFGNPNVYYELALRHATRKPAVQLTRASDPLPFDVGQVRTVVIDMSDIYTLVPQLDLHRQEIARQARAALDEGHQAESPLSRFYPRFWDELPGSPAE
jgi:hypothetical protein